MLATPFRCTAVDLVGGEVVVMNQGSLPLALSATMALPGLMDPIFFVRSTVALLCRRSHATEDSLTESQHTELGMSIKQSQIVREKVVRAHLS